MASLAPHVSRVAKDYAPFGWSYITEVTVSWAAQVTAQTLLPLIHASDSDYYIESIEFSTQTVGRIEVANHFSWGIDTYNNAGVDQTLPLQSAVPHPTALTRLTWTDLAVDQNQLLADGNVLVLDIDDSAGTGADVTGVIVRIRYRRKA